MYKPILHKVTRQFPPKQSESSFVYIGVHNNNNNPVLAHNRTVLVFTLARHSYKLHHGQFQLFSRKIRGFKSTRDENGRKRKTEIKKGKEDK